MARAALDRLSRKLRKAGRHMAVLDPPVRHRARIKAKKLRYAAEFFAETFGRHAKKRRAKFIASLAKLQDTLGDLNDLTVGYRTLIDATGEDAALTSGAGCACDKQDSDEVRLLQKAVCSYKDWRHAKAFWQ